MRIMGNTANTVGAFTFEGGIVSGPAAYMAERGNARLDNILAGGDTVFNAGTRFAPQGTSVATLVLVSLQTDYAAWLGAQSLAAGIEVPS